MDKIVEKYTYFRILGKNLNAKMTNCNEIKLDILTAGKKLNMLENNAFVFESIEDMDVVMDFALFEILVNNKSFTERYYELDLPESEDEGMLLECKLEAFTSLFEIVDVDRKKRTIYIIDLLDPEKKYSFIYLLLLFVNYYYL